MEGHLSDRRDGECPLDFPPERPAGRLNPIGRKRENLEGVLPPVRLKESRDTEAAIVPDHSVEINGIRR
jgi:hypothetical protein